MKLLLSTLFLIGSMNLVKAQDPAGLPVTVTIGNVDVTGTEFNIGEGNTDESTSLNHILITNTSGLLDELINDPAVNALAGDKYYEFTILAPGCLAPVDGASGGAALTLDATYFGDGHNTGDTQVEVELNVGIWESTGYMVGSGDTKKLGFCLQADIMLVNAQDIPVAIETKQFDFLVTPILSTFMVNDKSLADGTIVVDNSDGETSGTEITALWRSTNPLPPGEPMWIELGIVDQDYSFTKLEWVNMKVGANAEVPIMTGSIYADNQLTSEEVTDAGKKLQFYHILPRTLYTTSDQTLLITGKALVDYIPARRLRGVEEERQLTTENSEFTIKATLTPDDGSDSGSYIVKIVSVMVSGAGVIGATLL